jgi:hypothetical protein
MPDASPTGPVKDTLFSEYQYLYENGPANDRQTSEGREISDKIRGHKFWHELEEKYVP